jgi:DNA-directed RNA polymerase specialized sigma24 family protein
LRQKQYDEIAETLNIPIGSVKGMIFRVREMLQSQLKPVYQTL